MSVFDVKLKHGRRIDAWYGIPLKDMGVDELIHVINLMAEYYDRKVADLKNADERRKMYGAANYEDL